MKPYFNTPERVAKLVIESNKWNGTPWSANTQSCGYGVACHNLPRAIYMECGAWGKDFPVVVGDPNGSRHIKESLIEKMCDGRPELQRLRIGVDKFMPGDLLGIRIYSCVDHLGICLGETFAHVLMHKNTSLDDRWDVSPWAERITAAWRPIEL